LPPYNVSLSETGTYTFSAASYGYATAPTPLTVTVTNAGYNATGALTVDLSGTNAGDLFELPATTLSSIAVDGTGSFTVTPKTGLPFGTYTATVTVSGDNDVSKSFDVSFEVTKKNITITPDAAQSKIYGTPDPALTYTATGCTSPRRRPPDRLYNTSGLPVKIVPHIAGETTVTQLPAGIYAVVAEGRSSLIIVR
jgi:hypothetical protein